MTASSTDVRQSTKSHMKQNRRRRPRWAELLAMNFDDCLLQAGAFLRWTLPHVQHAAPTCVDPLLTYFCKSLRFYNTSRGSRAEQDHHLPTCHWHQRQQRKHERQSLKKRTRMQFKTFQKPRIAYVVLAHGHLQNLRRLIKQVLGASEASRDTLIVHIDRSAGGKKQAATLAAWWRRLQLRHYNKVGNLVAWSAHRVARGGRNMMLAAIHSLNKAYVRGAFSHFVLLSGSDLLLRTRQSFYWTLWMHRHLNLIPVGSIEWMSPQTELPHLSTYHAAHRSARMPRRLVFECGHKAFGLAEIAHEVGIPPKLLHANGAQWAALAPEFARDLLASSRLQNTTSTRNLDVLKWIFDYGMAMQQPDERLLPTMLLNSIACTRHVGFNMHVVNSRGGSLRSSNSDFDILSPESFSTRHWSDELAVLALMHGSEKPDNLKPFGAASSALAHFGRKFSSDKEGAVLAHRLQKQATSLQQRLWLASTEDRHGRSDSFTTSDLDSLQAIACDTLAKGLVCMKANMSSECRLRESYLRLPAADNAYDAMQIRLTLRLSNCCPVNSESLTMAARDCCFHGSICMEESLAMAPTLEIPSDDLAIVGMVSGTAAPSDLPVRVLAMRVGARWNPSLRTFLGPVSVIDAKAAPTVTLVVYISPSAWSRDVLVSWRLQSSLQAEGASRRYTIESYVATAVFSFPEKSMTSGTWSVSIFSVRSLSGTISSDNNFSKGHQMRKHLKMDHRQKPELVAWRTFAVVDNSYGYLHSEGLMQTYFATIPCPLRAEIVDFGSSRQSPASAASWNIPIRPSAKPTKVKTPAG